MSVMRSIRLCLHRRTIFHTFLGMDQHLVKINRCCSKSTTLIVRIDRDICDDPYIAIIIGNDHTRARCCSIVAFVNLTSSIFDKKSIGITEKLTTESFRNNNRFTDI